jgi:hypothetical protein
VNKSGSTLSRHHSGIVAAPDSSLAVFAVIAAERSAIGRIFSAEILEFRKILQKKNSEGDR